jgi:hypothetical protein
MALKDFLVPLGSWRNAHSIFTNIGEYYLRAKTNAADAKLQHYEILAQHDLSANSEFNQLSVSNNASVLGDLLFVSGESSSNLTSAKAEFTRHLERTAQSFLRSRSDLEDLLVLTLSTLQRAGACKKPEPAQERECKSVFRPVADMVVGLISLRNLRIALEVSKNSDLANILREKLGKDYDKCEVWSGEDPSLQYTIQQTIISYLVRDPMKAGAELLRLHGVLKAGIHSLEPKAFDCKYVSSGAYGPVKLRDEIMKPMFLAYGLTVGPREIGSFADPGQLSRNLAHVGQLGFEKARLDEGIEKLIDTYLRASEGDPKKAAQAKLLTELVHFAQKILFMANNSVLLNTSHRQQLMILQAVGNSIMSQADEIKHQTRRDTSREAAGRTELDAMSKALKVSPEETVAHWRNILSQKLTTLGVGSPTTDEVVGAINALTKAKEVLKPTDDEAKVKQSKYQESHKKLDAINAFSDLLTTEKDTLLKGDGKGDRFIQVLSTYIQGMAAAQKELTMAGLNLVKGQIETNKNEKAEDTYSAAKEVVMAEIAADDKADRDAKVALNEVQTKRDQLAAKLDEAKNDAERKTQALPLGVASGLLAKYKLNTNSSPSPSELREIVVRELRERNPDKASQEGINVVDVLPLPLSIQPIVTNPTNALTVIDALAACLRYRQVAAVAGEGMNSPTAKNMEDALTILMTHRSGMVYLRPAAAYLRTSYAASTLQDNDGLAWENMLSRHARRQLPFGSIFEPNASTALTVAEIDKQFWQNVNRVRVAGSGRANQVIAKDDVGNWYVKSYSADASMVYRSAIGLAKFASGVGPSTSGTNASGSNVTSAVSPTLKLQAEFAKEYTNSTETTFQSVTNAIKDLADTMSSAWSNAGLTNQLATTLKGLAKTDSLDKQVKESDKALDGKVDESGRETVKLLRALKRYYHQVHGNIDTAKLDSTSEVNDKSLKAKAQVVLRDSVRDVINRVLTEREKSIAQYESALVILGKAK